MNLARSQDTKSIYRNQLHSYIREWNNWKLKFLHLSLRPCNEPLALSTIAAYMLYFNDYENVVNDFMTLCSDMADMREEYAKFPVIDLIRFECKIYEFYFYILVAYQNSPESNAWFFWFLSPFLKKLDSIFCNPVGKSIFCETNFQKGDIFIKNRSCSIQKNCMEQLI